MSGKMLTGLPVFMDIDATGHRWIETPDIVAATFLSAGINHKLRSFTQHFYRVFGVEIDGAIN